ncbi:hypothetical protein OQA88_1098 [Cercophora sp. LCS_1]
MDKAKTTTEIGLQVLREIEETSLDELLSALRTSLIAADEPQTTATATATASATIRDFPLPRLNDIVASHFHKTKSPVLALHGRYYELLYPLVATLIAPPHEKAIAIVDFGFGDDGGFEVLRLLATRTATGEGLHRGDLEHVYVVRPPPGDAAHVERCVIEVERHMLYGEHKSREREWWGMVVIGGGLFPGGTRGGHNVVITAGRSGWLRVERAEVEGFGRGAEEAFRQREGRQRAVEERGWAASSEWGGFVFRGG